MQHYSHYRIIQRVYNSDVSRKFLAYAFKSAAETTRYTLNFQRNHKWTHCCYDATNLLDTDHKTDFYIFDIVVFCKLFHPLHLEYYITDVISFFLFF